jgi:hypothetical protein
VPELRIVSDDLWQKVHERLDEARIAYLRGTNGKLFGRPAQGVESKYLLPGLARCGVCGGSMYVKSRSHGKKRAYFYGCTSFHLRGSTVCPNSLEVPMPTSDVAVLDAIESDILRPEIISATLRKTVAKLKPSTEATQARRADLEKRLADVTRELERLTAAIVAGGSIDTLVEALRQRETQRETIRRELASLDATLKPIDWRRLDREITTKLTDWKALLRRHVPQARQVLKKLIAGPIVFTPHRENGARYYAFRAEVNLGKVIAGLACANMVASPNGMANFYTLSGSAVRAA